MRGRVEYALFCTYSLPFIRKVACQHVRKRKQVSEKPNQNFKRYTEPVIRPVLDLSDVSSGMGRMNRMFGVNPSIEVLSNIGAIQAGMNQRQNTGNADVIWYNDNYRSCNCQCGNLR